MRVGIFAGNLPNTAGGGYTLQADLIRAIPTLAGDSRHTFVIFAPRQSDSWLAEEIPNIQVISYGSGGVIDKIRNKLRIGNSEPHGRGEVDQQALNAQIEFVWSLSPGLIVSDLPYMVTVLDLQHRLQPWFPEVSKGGQWDRREAQISRSLRRASFVIVGTESGRREVEGFYQVPSDRIRILPHPTPGFALGAGQPEPSKLPEKLGIPPGYILYPAQFWPHKNHTNLLLAIHDLRVRHHITLPVVLVGSDHGNLIHIKQFTDELGLSDQVHFLGFVEQADLINLYRNAFALAYLSFFGPENLPPLEAFALGCPVIASKVAGSEEQLGHAALLVDPTRPREIADSIRRLHEDASMRDSLVERGFDRARQWTADDFVRGVFRILDEFEAVRRSWGIELWA